MSNTPQISHKTGRSHYSSLNAEWDGLPDPSDVWPVTATDSLYKVMHAGDPPERLVDRPNFMFSRNLR